MRDIHSPGLRLTCLTSHTRSTSQTVAPNYSRALEIRVCVCARDYIERSAELREALDLIASGHFSRGDGSVFAPLVENLRNLDPFLVLADYAAYVTCQDQVSAAWQDVDRWTRSSILNTARSGKFSSDRAIREYCDEVWNVSAVPVPPVGGFVSPSSRPT
jgi:glucan phosphorylase